MKIAVEYQLTDADGHDLEDRLLEIAVRRLLDNLRESGDLKNDVYGRLRERVEKIRDAEIAEALRPLIAETIEAVLQPTNRLGEPTGEPTTLRSLIVDEARKQLSRSTDKGGYGHKETALDQALQAAVGAALRSELSDAVKKAKAEVYEAAKNEAARILTESLARLVKP